MKVVSTVFSIFFIGSFIWVVYLVWIIFFSEDIVQYNYISAQKFKAEVNSTYYNFEKKIIKIDNEIKFNSNYKARPWETIKAFDNLENNTSQRVLKKEFEHLLAMYLKIENLYSKEELQRMKDLNIFVYNSFYRILNIYIEYLQQNPNQENHKLLYKIVDKNLKNFYQLMKNSNNFTQYATSLMYLEKFLESLTCSNDFIALFKEYPLVNKELFFEKLKLGKEQDLKNWKSQLPPKQKENVLFMKVMSINHKYINKMINELYRKEVIAMRDGSAEAKENYEEYLEQLKHQDYTFSSEFMKLWNLCVKEKIDIKSRGYIYGVVVFGYVHRAKFHFEVYEKQKYMSELYREFLSGCK